jgi:hypothetical protein
MTGTGPHNVMCCFHRISSRLMVKWPHVVGNPTTVTPVLRVPSAGAPRGAGCDMAKYTK